MKFEAGAYTNGFCKNCGRHPMEHDFIGRGFYVWLGCRPPDPPPRNRGGRRAQPQEAKP